MEGRNAADIVSESKFLFRHGINRYDRYNAGHFNCKFVQHGTEAQAVRSGGGPEFNKDRAGR